MRCVGFLACVLLLLGTVIDVHAVVAPVCWPGSAAYDRHFYTNGYSISNVQNGETYVYASYGTSSTGHAPLYRMRPDGTQRRAVLCSDAFEPSTNCTFRSSFVRAPSYFHIDEDNKYLYFFEATSKAIGRIPLSLTGKVAWILCSTSFTGPCTKKLPKFADFGIKGYVVDSKVTHRIYFMDGADYIGSSPLPGQTGDTRRLLCSALFCDFQFNVTALASLELDLVSDPKRMYFAHGPGRISSAFLDGSNVKKLICNNSDCVTSHSYVNPLLISLDLVSPQKRLYWADVATGRVVRSRLDGTGTGTILCTVTGCPEVDAPDVAINFLHVVGSTTGPARVYVLDAYGREITGNDASILSLNGDGTLLKTELCGARKGCSRRYARLDSPTRPELGKGGPNVVLTFFTDYGLVYFDVTSGQLHEPALRNLEVSALSVASPSSGLYWSLNGRLVYEGSNGCNLAFGPTFTGRASTILCPDGCANRARHLIAQPEDVRIVGDPNTLYWVDKEVGAIITANFDGRNAKQVVCAANCQNKVHIQHKPYYLHVDSRGLGSSIGSKLYWISKDIKTVVWSANLDGTNIKKLQCTDLTCNIVSPPLGTDLTGFALDLHKPLPVLYIGDATNLAVLKINGDGSGYGGLICSSSCSDPSRNLGLKYIRRPEGLQLDLDSNIFPHDDSRLFFVDTLNNHAIAVDLDGSLDPVILTCEVDTGISCRKRIIGLALTGETLIVDDKGKRYFYYVGTVNTTHDVVIRHQIRATHDDDIKAAEVVLCSTGYPYGDCLHRIDGLNRPKNLVVRRDPGTGERELWFTQNNIPGETESVSSRQSLWRAQLDGGFAHIEVANGKLIPADCVPATTAFTNAECRELCPSRTNQGNCTRDKCTCNAA